MKTMITFYSFIILQELWTPIIMIEIEKLKSGIKNETQVFSVPDKTVKKHMLLIPSLNSGEMVKGTN